MKNKTRLNSLKTNFVKTTTKIFKMGLDSSTIAVYFYLCSCTEEFNPSVRNIAKFTKLSPTTVAKAMNKLKELNVIEQVAYARKGTTAKYMFIAPDHWRGNT